MIRGQGFLRDGRIWVVVCAFPVFLVVMRGARDATYASDGQIISCLAIISPVTSTPLASFCEIDEIRHARTCPHHFPLRYPRGVDVVAS